MTFTRNEVNTFYVIHVQDTPDDQKFLRVETSKPWEVDKETGITRARLKDATRFVEKKPEYRTTEDKSIMARDMMWRVRREAKERSPKETFNAMQCTETINRSFQIIQPTAEEIRILKL